MNELVISPANDMSHGNKTFSIPFFVKVKICVLHVSKVM
jgi:hypothetical protein